MKKGVRVLFLLIVLTNIGFISATVVSDDLHLNIQTVNSTGSIITGAFDFVFNISNVSDCTDDSKVLYSNTSTLTVDSRGILSISLPNVTLDYDEQYWLCYFRNGTLINNSKIARTPYAFRAMNVSGEGIINDSNVDLTNFNVTADTGFFTSLGSLLNGITNIFAQTINATGSIFSQEHNLTNAFLYATNDTFLFEANNTLIGNYSSNTDFCISEGACLSGLVAASGITWANAINGTLLTQPQALNGTLLTQTQALNGTWATLTQVYNGTLINWGEVINGTLLTQSQALNGTLLTQPQALNGTLLTQSQALNGTWATLTQVYNGTLINWAEAINGTLADNTTIAAYIDSQDTAFNDSMETYVDSQDASIDAITLDGFDSTFFQPLNETMVGDYNITGGLNVDGNWLDGGVTIDGGEIYAQTGFFYNITSLELSNLAVNGSLFPQLGWDNTFDIGNGTLRWQDLHLSGSALINGTVVSDGAIFSQGHNLTNAFLYATNDTFLFEDNNSLIGNYSSNTDFCVGECLTAKISWTNAINGTLLTQAQALNGTLLTQAQVLNGTWTTLTQTYNGTLINWGEVINGTLLTQSQALNGTLLTQPQALNGTWATLTQVYNGTFARTDAANNFGAFNQSFNTDTLFIDAVSGLVGIGTASPIGLLNLNGSGVLFNISNVSGESIFYVNSTTGFVGINTSTPTNTLNVLGDINATRSIFSQEKNLSTGFDYALNSTGDLTWANAINGTLLTQPQALNGTWATLTQVYNGTFARTDVANNFGAFNQSFNTDTLFIDAVSGLVGIGTVLQTYVLEVHNSSTTGKDVNLSNVFFVNGTSVNVGINTSTPTNTLNVLGDINATGDLLVGTNTTINQTGITFFDGTLQTTATAGGGAWQFVSGTAITNINYMNFTGLETGYDYSFSIQGAIPITDDVTLEARFSQSGIWIAGDLNYEDGAPANSISLLETGNTLGNAGYEGVHMEVTLPEPNVGSRVKRIIAIVAGSDTGNNETQKGIAGGRLNNTAAVDGVSFFFSSGNWSDNGTIYVFRKKLSPGAAVTITSNIWNDSGSSIYQADLTNKIGIGTASPIGLLNLNGSGVLFNISNVSGESIFYVSSTTGFVGIGTASPSELLHINGSGILLNISNASTSFLYVNETSKAVNITGNLTVGGELILGGADYAEMFESDYILEKGDVVCLDGKNKISKCTKRADYSVIGAVSSNPSIIGRNFGFKNSYPVGFVGIVPVKVTGPVNRFELLTTSSKQGFAEKATYRDFGAIIGKSMGSCYKEECLIDVIVGLK